MDRAALVIRVAASISALKTALSEGKALIDVTAASMARMSASYDGSKVIGQAAATAASIQNLGGISKLTAAEQDKANRIYEQAAEKLTALGKTEAAAMYAKLAEETKRVVPALEAGNTATQSWASTLGGNFKSQFLGTLAGFVSAQAIIGAVSGAFNLAIGAIVAVKDAVVSAVMNTANLGDLLLTTSKKFDVSVERASAWRYVADQAGTSLDAIMSNVGKLQTVIGTGGDKVEKALGALGTSLSAIRSMRPDEAFEQILTKLRDVPRESDRAAIGVALFGKGFREVAQLTREDIGAMMTRFGELGGKISTEMAVSGDAFNDAKGDWNLLVERIETSVGAAILPAATAFTNILVNAVQKTLNESGVSAAQFQSNITQSFSAVVDITGLLLRATGFLVQGFLELWAGPHIKQGAELVTLLTLVGTATAKLGMVQAQLSGSDALSKFFSGAIKQFSDIYTAAKTIGDAGAQGIEVFDRLAESIGKIGDEMKGKGKAAIAEVQAQIAASAAEIRKAQEAVTTGTGILSTAADKYAESLKKIADQSTGAAAVKVALDYSKALMEQGRIIPITTAGMLALVKVFEAAFQSTKPLPPEVQRLGFELMKLGQLEPPVTRGMGELWKQIEQLGKVAPDTNAYLMMLTEGGIKTMTVGTKEGGAAFADMLKGLGKAQAEIPPATKATSALGDALDIVAQLADLFSDVLGDVFSALGQYVTAMDQAKTAGDRTAAAQQLASSAFMIGIGLLLQWGQRMDAAREAGLAMANQLTDTNQEIIAQYGSFARAAEAAERYGLKLDAVRTKYMSLSASGTARTGPNNVSDADQADRLGDQLGALKDVVDILTSAVEKYGLAWTDMPDPKDRLAAATAAARDLYRVFDILVKSGYDVDTVVNLMSDDINDWLGAVLDAGVEIPVAMQAVIDSLILTGQITDENAMKMLGFVGDAVPSIDEIRAAAERYGFTWEQVEAILERAKIATQAAADAKLLEDVTAAAERYGIALKDMGEAFQGAKMRETIDGLLKDFALLTGSGVGPDAAIRGMSGALNQLLIDAATTGTQLPETMRPMIEQMIRMGLVTDEAARAMLGLGADTTPSLADITAAAERYGLTLDQLGPKVQQIRLTEAAGTIVDDFNLLIAAGVPFDTLMADIVTQVTDTGESFSEMSAEAQRAYTDAGGTLTSVTSGMRTDIQDLVSRSIAMGLELPASMRPMLAAMVEGGLLTNGMGENLRDLSGLTFATDLSGMFEDLILKLDDLIGSITGDDGVGGALDQLPGAAADADSAMTDAGAAGESAFQDAEVAVKDAEDAIKNCWDRSLDFQQTMDAADYVTPFDAGTSAAERMRDMVNEVADAVDRVSYGESPGGLKEWTPMMTQAALAAARSSDRMVSDFDRVLRAANRMSAPDSSPGFSAPAGFSSSGRSAGGGYAAPASSASSSASPMNQTIIVQVGEEVIGRIGARAVPGQVRLYTR